MTCSNSVVTLKCPSALTQIGCKLLNESSDCISCSEAQYQRDCMSDDILTAMAIRVNTYADIDVALVEESSGYSCSSRGLCNGPIGMYMTVSSS